MMDSAIVEMLGYVLAALMIGLWLGERGRRIAAERMVTYGTTEKSKPVTMLATPEAEDRYLDYVQQFSEEALGRASTEILEAARKEGLPMTDRDARLQAARMLSGEDVLPEGVSP